MSSTATAECPSHPLVVPDHTSTQVLTPPFEPVLPTASSQPESLVPSASSVPYSNIPLSSGQMLQLQQDSPNWIAELLKKSLFDGLDLQILSERELQETVASLLSIAYETRDLHIAELLALERQHRREALALELKKRTLLDARAKISVDYTELDDVKSILSSRGFEEEVRKYVKRRDAPIGCRVPPSDLAYVYHPTDVHSTRLCANELKPAGTSANGIVIAV